MAGLFFITQSGSDTNKNVLKCYRKLLANFEQLESSLAIRLPAYRNSPVLPVCSCSVYAN